MRPSAPTAIAALLIGITRSLWPTAWEGSTIIGSLLNFLITGIADKSRVNLVDGSNVLIPLSQSTTSVFPEIVIYSTAKSHSFKVDAHPLFNITDLFIAFATCPTFFSREKLDMFLVSICRTYTYFATSSRDLS